MWCGYKYLSGGPGAPAFLYLNRRFFECEAGLEPIRDKSLRMTSYLMYLADELLSGTPYHIGVITPREPARRGGHVALTHTAEALRIKEVLASRGIVVDFRPPDVIRIAPSPLYSTYHDIWTVVRHMREIIGTREYEKIPPKRKAIS